MTEQRRLVSEREVRRDPGISPLRPEVEPEVPVRRTITSSDQLSIFDEGKRLRAQQRKI